MKSTPSPEESRRRGPPLALMIAGLAAGCARPTAPSVAPAPAPAATGPAAAANTAPAVTLRKIDREAVLAGLKEDGIQVVEPKGVVVRSFRYANLTEPLDLIAEVEQTPVAPGQVNPLEYTLPPDGLLTGDGTFDMVLLPAASTGRPGTQIVFVVAPDGDRRRSVVHDTPPLWFQWPGVRPRVQTRLDGGPLNPKPGRMYKLIAYSTGDPNSLRGVTLNLRCRTAKRAEPSPDATSRPSPPDRSRAGAPSGAPR
jgi:hypothetical protein